MASDTPRRVVVTGASGNVGTALLLRLGSDPRYEVHGISRRPPAPEPPYSWADWTPMDIGEPGSLAHLAAAFDGADAVVHLAWRLQSYGDRAFMRRTNVDGTRAVLAAARMAGVPHVVHQSSVGAYAPGPKRLTDETWPTTGIPSSTYSVDKAEAERLVDAAADELAIACLRPGLIFQEAAASEVARYFLGRAVPYRMVGHRLARLAPLPDAMAFQVVHADDVAAAIELVLQRQAVGAYNVAADPVIDRDGWRSAFGAVGPALPPAVLRAAAAASWRLRLQPTEPGWVDLARCTPLLDSSRLRALGWTARHDSRDTLARFVEAIGRGAGRPGPLLHRAAAGGRASVTEPVPAAPTTLEHGRHRGELASERVQVVAHDTPRRP